MIFSFFGAEAAFSIMGSLSGSVQSRFLCGDKSECGPVEVGIAAGDAGDHRSRTTLTDGIGAPAYSASASANRTSFSTSGRTNPAA
jgi:hypothetical protein